MFRKTLLLCSVVSMVAIGSPAFASDQMSIKEIQAQLLALSAQVESLSNIVDQQNETIASQAAALETQKYDSAQAEAKMQETVSQAVADITPAAGGVDTGDVKITMKPMPKIESADGQYSFQPFGRVHMDVTAFDDDKNDYASNANFRRARLGFKGNLGEDFKYKTEVDFAGNDASLQEVALTYTGLDAADIKIGNHRPALGMEQNTSSNYIMFIERSAPTNTFTRGRELGINTIGGGDDWFWAAGIFNESAGNEGTGEDEDITYDFRTSVNILGLAGYETDAVLHLGAGYSHRRPTGNVRFRARPGTGDGDRTIDTGSISDVETSSVYSAELGAVVGPFSMQGEYFSTDLARENGNADAQFDGYYAQAGYFLTGESRPYKAGSGVFGRVKPNSPFSLSNGGSGAVEVLVRYDQTDLNDQGAGILGGQMETYTAGVNWHLTDHVRLMANVITVDSDGNASPVADDDPTIYNMRAQWDF